MSKYSIDMYVKRNFLHSIPENLNTEYNLEKLLESCSTWEMGDKYFKNRFEIAQLLVDRLKIIEKIKLK